MRVWQRSKKRSYFFLSFSHAFSAPVSCYRKTQAGRSGCIFFCSCSFASTFMFLLLVQSLHPPVFGVITEHNLHNLSAPFAPLCSFCPKRLIRQNALHLRTFYTPVSYFLLHIFSSYSLFSPSSCHTTRSVSWLEPYTRPWCMPNSTRQIQSGVWMSRVKGFRYERRLIYCFHRW